MGKLLIKSNRKLKFYLLFSINFNQFIGDFKFSDLGPSGSN